MLSPVRYSIETITYNVNVIVEHTEILNVEVLFLVQLATTHLKAKYLSWSHTKQLNR